MMMINSSPYSLLCSFIHSTKIFKGKVLCKALCHVLWKVKFDYLVLVPTQFNKQLIDAHSTPGKVLRSIINKQFLPPRTWAGRVVLIEAMWHSVRGAVEVWIKYMRPEMENNYIKGQEKKIQKGFRDEIAFEVNPKEWLEFCLGEWARARGAFLVEGTQMRRFADTKMQGPISGLWWFAYGVPASRKLTENEARHRQVLDWKEEWLLFQSLNLVYEPVVSKPGYADSWALSTTSLSQSEVGSKSLCFHQGLQTMHSHGWDPLQWRLPGLSVKESHYHHWTMGRPRSRVK